jgi:hypothetical protein
MNGEQHDIEMPNGDKHDDEAAAYKAEEEERDKKTEQEPEPTADSKLNGARHESENEQEDRCYEAMQGKEAPSQEEGREIETHAADEAVQGTENRDDQIQKKNQEDHSFKETIDEKQADAPEVTKDEAQESTDPQAAEHSIPEPAFKEERDMEVEQAISTQPYAEQDVSARQATDHASADTVQVRTSAFRCFSDMQRWLKSRPHVFFSA